MMNTTSAPFSEHVQVEDNELERQIGWDIMYRVPGFTIVFKSERRELLIAFKASALACI